VRIGIDTGGTFTDFILVQDGRARVHKEPSTPTNPAEAVVRGLRLLVPGIHPDIIHGSTVATNALLERTGARTALVTTAGFEDLLVIGRQARRDIYDLEVDREPPLVPSDMCLGAEERLGHDGKVVTPLAQEQVAGIARKLQAMAPEAVAICLLHSYSNPEHEERIEAALRAENPAWYLSRSSEVLPEFREYERCSTTAINAYVGPLMAHYLDDLARRCEPRSLHVLQSNGGTLDLRTARRQPVHTILSGPAGGVVGARERARRADCEQIITFDMGGTSTDVSLCPGELSRTSESRIGDLPIGVPVLDIHTVGAGGGSIAWRDDGGALRVGPQSAGSVPGPACYGRGGSSLTVTDANLILGRLSAKHFLGGQALLQIDAAREAAAPLADALAMSVEELADGVIDVANATMEAAIRVISVQRGHDPRDFTLVCFGGAGGMHAAAIADALAIARILVPPFPGILSAYGMLLADAVCDYSQTYLRDTEDTTVELLERAFMELEQRAREDELLGSQSDQVVMARALDVRYRGQGYEITIPFDAAFVERFHATHERRYGYCDRERPTQIVTVRLQARAPAPRSQLQSSADRERRRAAVAGANAHEIRFADTSRPALLLHRDRLVPGDRFAGPALIVEYSATTVVPPGWECGVDDAGNLLLTRDRSDDD